MKFSSAYIFIIATSSLALITSAQPAVRNEPRHHNVFENDCVRILDVFVPPGDTTQFHVHSTPSVFIMFTKTATGSQLLGRQPVSDISVAGASWYDTLANPRIHRVWDEDSTWFHAMDIELIADSPTTHPPHLENLHLTMYFNEPLASGYRLQLKAGETIQLPGSPRGYLLVSTGNAGVACKTGNHTQRRAMKNGHYVWIDPGDSFSMSIHTQAPANFLVLQFK